eukprot:360874-Chlamydomonas_euryale.AAC.8
MQALVDAVIVDLLAVQHLPEWPAAQLLLRRLVAQLNTPRGLRHDDAAIRLMCIDFLTAVVVALVHDARDARNDANMVLSIISRSGCGDAGQAVVGSSAGTRGATGDVSVKQEQPASVIHTTQPTWPQRSCEIAQQLLLRYLATGSQTATSSRVSASHMPRMARSARSLLAAQMLRESLLEECKVRKACAGHPTPIPRGMNPSWVRIVAGHSEQSPKQTFPHAGILPYSRHALVGCAVQTPGSATAPPSTHKWGAQAGHGVYVCGQGRYLSRDALSSHWSDEIVLWTALDEWISKHSWHDFVPRLVEGLLVGARYHHGGSPVGGVRGASNHETAH